MFYKSKYIKMKLPAMMSFIMSVTIPVSSLPAQTFNSAVKVFCRQAGTNIFCSGLLPG